MKNVTVRGISEGKAIEAIFNACRSNEKREERGNVSFMLCANGSHEAILRDEAGVVIALANVDEYDV